MRIFLSQEDFIDRGQEITIRVIGEGAPFTFPSAQSIRNSLITAYTFLDKVEVKTSFFSNEYALEFEWTGLKERVTTIVDNILLILHERHGQIKWSFAGSETGRKGLSETGDTDSPLPSFNQVMLLIIALVILFALIAGLAVFREFKGITR